MIISKNKQNVGPIRSIQDALGKNQLGEQHESIEQFFHGLDFL